MWGTPKTESNTPVSKAGSPQEEEQKESSQIQVPQILLTKGGDAMKGIGEKFATGPITGADSLSIPISSSPDRSGFGLQLSLSNDSGSGNGP